MALEDSPPTARDYVIGMLALTQAHVPFGWHRVQVTAYCNEEAVYSAIVRVLGEYDDPVGIVLRTVYIGALTKHSHEEAHEVATKAFVRMLPTQGAVA